MNSPTAAAVLALLEQEDAPVLNLLAFCRKNENLVVWTQGPELVRRFTHLLLKQGHPTLALECAARGLDTDAYAEDHELLYSRALALARSGNATRAAQFVRALLDRTDLAPQLRSNALALAGRVRKDVAYRTDDPAVRDARLRMALDYYRRAFELSGDTFPGINAATLALLAGDLGQSRRLAAQVRDAIRTALDSSGQEADPWQAATLGEAYLLLDDRTAARGCYVRAVQLFRAARNDGDLATVRRQLLLLREHLPFVDDVLGLFHLGPVVVFAGHGLDRPGDPVRFPADPTLEAAVRQAIQHELDLLGTTIGYCSPGCGSDILFGELMRERDAELHVVLPFAESDFHTERLTFGLPALASWGTRYEKLHGHLRVTTHFATTEEYLNDHILYDFGGAFMQGLALTRAALVGVETVALVVRDPAPQPGPSGLTSFVANWNRLGRELRVIDLAAVRGGVNLTQPPFAGLPEQAPPHEPRRTVQAMLFADVAGFSGLREAHLPAFFIEFLGIVGEQLQATPALFQNTWGDGLYLVFANVVPCADFALRLLRRLERFDFAAFQFKLAPDKQPGVRIGLHTGPVFKGFDAVLRKDNYFGSHVSRAARIEPVTTPGCAFVSEQFAAALALTPGHDFVCEYLGLQPLAKDYDTCPLYRLTERTVRGFPD